MQLAGPDMTSSERILEGELVSKLQELKYSYRGDIRDRATLEANFREKFRDCQNFCVRRLSVMSSGSAR